VSAAGNFVVRRERARRGELSLGAPAAHVDAALGQQPAVLRLCTLCRWRALTSTTSQPRSTRIPKSGIQYTPVDSIATVLTPHCYAVRQAVTLGGEGAEFVHRLGVAFGWDGDNMAALSAIDAGRIGLDAFQQ
jgi:hypothetical protein